MKTRYSHRRTFLISQRWLGTGSVVLGIAVLVVLVRVVAPGALIAVANPFWKLGAAASETTTGLTESFGNAATLAAERDRLSQANADLTLENTALTQKVADLSALLGGRAAGTGILAGVLARPPFAPYDTLVLDQGSGAGVVEGALVTGNGGAPLGTISEVTTGASRVALFSSPGTATAAWIGTTHIPATVNGAGAGAFSLSMPSGSEIAVGDVVYVAGPGALPIATVTRLITDPSSAFTEVELKPLVNPFSIVWVEVAPHAFK
jgi:cell shape-determining protein MreC